MNTNHRRVELRIAAPGGVELAVTLHLPPVEAVLRRRAVIFALPGGGYNRHYFDIRFPGLDGYSEAEHHVADGVIVVAIDHLGVGDSSLPDPSMLTLAQIAASNDAVVREIVQRLHAGLLDATLPPLAGLVCIGIGQSMGGCLLTIMQGRHRTFDGVAILGASVVHTRMPMRPGVILDVPESANHAEVAALLTAQVDWRYIFHWEDVPQLLVDADLSGGLPLRRTAPVWGSLTTPPCAAELVAPGALTADAAAIDVPVLVAMGERDVCSEARLELGAFRSATDLSLYVLPHTAHMHNFAGTRERLWRRIDRFVSLVADDR